MSKIFKNLGVLLLPALVSLYSYAELRHESQHGHALFEAQSQQSQVDSVKAGDFEGDTCSVFHSTAVSLDTDIFTLQVSLHTQTAPTQSLSRVYLASYLIPHSQAPPAHSLIA